MNNYTLINNNFVLSGDAKISIKERAFKFGDGVFETCKIFNSRIYDFSSHKKRLENGLAALGIDFKAHDLEQKCYELIAKNEIENGILRISVSRGVGSMGYLAANEIDALLVIETMIERKVTRKNIDLSISEYELWKKPEFLQKCKTMQSLNYILAKNDARKKGFFDDVMLDENGFIGECSSSNIFWISDNKIFTPSMKCGILDGCVRQKIISNFDVTIGEFLVDDLQKADEVFLTNSNLLVLGVDKINFGDFEKNYSKKNIAKITEFMEKDLENDTKN